MHICRIHRETGQLESVVSYTLMQYQQSATDYWCRPPTTDRRSHRSLRSVAHLRGAIFFININDRPASIHEFSINLIIFRKQVNNKSLYISSRAQHKTCQYHNTFKLWQAYNLHIICLLFVLASCKDQSWIYWIARTDDDYIYSHTHHNYCIP